MQQRQFRRSVKKKKSHSVRTRQDNPTGTSCLGRREELKVIKIWHLNTEDAPILQHLYMLLEQYLCEVHAPLKPKWKQIWTVCCVRQTKRQTTIHMKGFSSVCMSWTLLLVTYLLLSLHFTVTSDTRHKWRIVIWATHTAQQSKNLSQFWATCEILKRCS